MGLRGPLPRSPYVAALSGASHSSNGSVPLVLDSTTLALAVGAG